MTTVKRPRACDPCHSIKIKCELGSTGGIGPCDRCVRLGKGCEITPPKSQKDRVAELEAQVAALTKLLDGQNINSPSSISTSNDAVQASNHLGNETKSSALGSVRSGAEIPQKKRRLEEDNSALPSELVSSEFDLQKLDSLVPKDLQIQLLKKYLEQIVPLCPLIPLVGQTSYEKLRQTRPLLLQTIVYAVSSGVLDESLQEDLGAIVLDTFATLTSHKHKWTVELIQAIHITVLWYRAPKGRRQIAAFQLAQQAADIAEEISLWGSQRSLFLNSAKADDGNDTAEILRTYLVLHLLSANLTVLMRKSSLQNLSEFDDFSLHMLNYLEDSLPIDRLLCHFVRAEKLCDRIVSEMDYDETYGCPDISDPLVQLRMQGLANSITDWKTQQPTSPESATLDFYEHVATLYLHETVLHTPANKQSFAAPFLAERLSVTDFPAPIVTPEHVASIYALKSAAQIILDTFATFDIQTWLALPFLPFVGRVAYAEYILVKLYIACTASGNTFGTFLDGESLQVERYLDQLIDTAQAAQKIDSSCPAARILLAPARLKDFYLKYKASNLETLSTFTDSDYYSLTNTPATSDMESFNWPSNGLNNQGLDFDLDALLETSAAPEFLDTSTLNDLT